MAKPCKFCGAQLPEGAAFCPVCARAQTEPEEKRAPRTWRKWTALLLGAAGVIALAVGITLWVQGPKVYDNGGAELQYQGYHVLLTRHGSSVEPRPVDYEMSSELLDGEEYGWPSQLIAYRDNDTVNAKDEFAQLIEYATVEATPRDGARTMDVEQPGPADPFPGAILLSQLLYTSETGTNDILWTVRMKNGDTLLLHQVVTTLRRPTLTYYPDTEDMSTVEKLQALLERISGEAPENAAVILHLPPVRYEGGLDLDQRSFTLYGSSDGNLTTTFTGPIRVRSQSPDYTTLRDLRLEGGGQGVGFFASVGTVLQSCTVSGWQTGAQAVNGGFISAQFCTFEDNDVGLAFNTHEAKLTADILRQPVFRRNRVGLLLTDMPANPSTLRLEDPVFEDNQADVQNDSAAAVEYTTGEEPLP